MERIEKLKSHYNFTSEDAKNLERLRPIMDGYVDEFAHEFYRKIRNFEDAETFLKDDETIKRHQEGLREWFRGLFSGDYGVKYFAELEKVGMAHVKIKLSAHYVNAAMHFVNRYTTGIVKNEIKDDRELQYMLNSVHKILDINLDVLTSSYIEEEKRTIFLSQKLENYLIQFANRFTYGLNLVLVLGLVILGAMVIALFVKDLTHIFDGDLEKGLLATLGSLLMLWVVIELMENEVRQLRGGKFAIKVFISVALVAIIRKILVTTLSASAETVQDQTALMGAIAVQVSLIGAVAVLGVVYWLIAKIE